MIDFSIVIPLYNKGFHIPKALESIKNQTHPHYEVLIINDGSTDNSVEIVQQWLNALETPLKTKFKVLNQKNGGVSAARNTGIINAKNEYIAFLDADDFWEANHLANFVRLIESFKDRVNIFSNASKKYQLNRYILPNLSLYTNYFGILDFFKVSTLSHGFINSSSVCVKKSAILENLFPVGMKNFEDVITWARIANHKGFAFSSEYTSVYVIENSEASTSVDFNNYFTFEQLLLKISYEQSGLKKYLQKIFLFSMLAARIQMSYNAYLQQTIKVFGKSKVVTLYAVIALLIPKILLKFLRNKRKQ